MKTPRPFVFSLALLFAPLALRAEDKPAPSPETSTPGRQRMAPAERLKAMKEKLGLTDEQEGKVKAIFEKNRGKRAELKGLSKEDRRSKMRETLKSEMEEVGAILTPEQKEKWKTEMKNRRGGAAKPKA